MNISTKKFMAIVVVTLAAFGLFSCQDSSQTEQEAVATKKEATAIQASAKPNSEEAAPKTKKAYPVIAFNEINHDFGDISQGDVVKHVFSFTNKGEAPLVISDIKTSCGCTTPSYTKEPIPSGGSGQIEVQFNSTGRSGIQKKQIKVITNTEGSISVLNISSNVLTSEDSPVKPKA